MTPKGKMGQEENNDKEDLRPYNTPSHQTTTTTATTQPHSDVSHIVTIQICAPEVIPCHFTHCIYPKSATKKNPKESWADFSAGSYYGFRQWCTKGDEVKINKKGTLQSIVKHVTYYNSYPLYNGL